MKRRRYSEQQKADAIKVVLEQGVPLAQAAVDLGIGASTLDKWVRDSKLSKANPLALSVDEREELKRLRKEVYRLKMERDILKKTAIYFVKASGSDAE